MANKKVKYELYKNEQNQPLTAANEFEFLNEYLIINEYGRSVGTKKIVDSLDSKFIMKDESEFEVSKEDFDKLVKFGRIRTKKEAKERHDLIKSKKPLYKMTNKERGLVLNDKPTEV